MGGSGRDERRERVGRWEREVGDHSDREEDREIDMKLKLRC